VNKNRSESGQGLVEYALILVLVAVVVIVILAMIGGGGLFGKRQAPMPTDVCPGTVANVIEQDAGNWKRNIIIDYTNTAGDKVHLLYGQDESSASPFQLYSRDIDEGDFCKQ
jgi:hypothetical protein